MNMTRPHRRNLHALLLSAVLPLAILYGSRALALFDPQDGPFPREGECDGDDPLFDDVDGLIGPDNNIGPGTLKATAIPEPSNLDDFVADRQAAIVLGKALFWDMQVGSDGVQACASCHFRAGADPRSKNQVAPGGASDNTFELVGPNGQLEIADFPLHQFDDPTDRTSDVLQSLDDVISSQGVILHRFDGVEPGTVADEGDLEADPVFNVDGENTRRVEPRNTPTMINAVFNHRNFWDGRADFLFNGVNEFGARDPDAQVLEADNPYSLAWVTLRIDNASLASQAVGPPRSTFEMGFIDRPFRDIGKRLVGAVPLVQQRVHENDSVLGDWVNDNGVGLDTTYGELISFAFQPRWWDSEAIIEVDDDDEVDWEFDDDGSSDDDTSGDDGASRQPDLDDDEYTLMQHNFSLFFGLAIQLYESTLVSDDAPIDQHFDDLLAGGTGTLTDEELLGMELFDEAGCVDCHSGPEFSSAAARAAVTGFDNPDADPTFQPPEQIERMFIGSCDIAVYDQGFYNIGVRPVEEDLGQGGLDPFGNPLSIAKLLTMDPNDVPSQELLTLTYPNLGNLGLVPAIEEGERIAVEGAFKIPSLRNVELTAPYFHNGGQRTLREVVKFYNRGGDFHDHVAADGTPQDDFMDLGIGALGLTEDEIDTIVTFMLTLTDQRVIDQAAPFDHPELFVPNGHVGDDDAVTSIRSGEAETDLLVVPEVGAEGGPLPRGFLE